MPLSSLASYLSTMQEFITHWTAWNNATSANNTLSNGQKVADLTQRRTDLLAAITAVETPRSQRQTAANDRDAKKEALRERLRQFRAKCQSDLAGSHFENDAPTIPPPRAGEGAFFAAMDRMQALWLDINAHPPAGFTAPLKLVGNFTAANHATALASLRTTYADYANYDQLVRNAISARDFMLKPIKDWLILYRQTILGQFAAGDALILSLPRVSPLAGSTPNPVALSATWNAGTGKVDFSWTPSSNAGLASYSLRSCDPPRYRSNDEQTVHTFAANLTSGSLLGVDLGLGVSGATKIFKLYVVTNDDNEKGSNSVKIIRP